MRIKVPTKVYIPRKHITWAREVQGINKLIRTIEILREALGEEGK